MRAAFVESACLQALRAQPDHPHTSAREPLNRGTSLGKGLHRIHVNGLLGKQGVQEGVGGDCADTGPG